MKCCSYLASFILGIGFHYEFTMRFIVYVCKIDFVRTIPDTLAFIIIGVIYCFIVSLITISISNNGNMIFLILRGISISVLLLTYYMYVYEGDPKLPSFEFFLAEVYWAGCLICMPLASYVKRRLKR